MTKVDIFSGFLGAGKTTLIKKLIKEAYQGEKLVLIENEFGEIGIDGGFLKEAGIEVTEMNSGCICCSLVGDFGEALKQVLTQFAPDRILIEPSGVGKLSDVIHAVKGVDTADMVLNSYTAVVDAGKCRMYMKNFGEFFNDQVKHAKTIVLSHTDKIAEDKLAQCLTLLKEQNEHTVIVTTPWDQLAGSQLLAAIEQTDTLEKHLNELAHEHEHEACPACGGHHHDHHHHHDHECSCSCHDHENHEHHHDHECSCGCHNHEHHHHHADEVFQSFGQETARIFTKEELNTALTALTDEDTYGVVLRAKGIVRSENGVWVHFDYVPGEPDIREGCADVTGRLCVIGAGLHEDALKTLFHL